jgi:hypothetical protein
MLHSLRNIFTPHHHNNFKARLLWPQSLIVLLGIFIMGRSLVDVFITIRPGVLGFASQISLEQIVSRTNQERLTAGISTLKTNPALDQAAQAKAKDMFDHNYWAHVSPTGVQPWSFIKSSGYTYLHAGENLARDFSDASSIVSAWMASPSHKKNLLDPRFQDIGVAVLDGQINGVETTIVVQLFGVSPSAQPSLPSTPAPEALSQTVSAIDPALVPGLDLSVAKVSPDSVMSPFDVKRSWALAFIVLITLTLAVDWFFVLKLNLIRISGPTWAHLTFFVTLLAIFIFTRSGLII